MDGFPTFTARHGLTTVDGPILDPILDALVESNRLLGANL